jgi:hypothetical protein
LFAGYCGGTVRDLGHVVMPFIVDDEQDIGEKIDGIYDEIVYLCRYLRPGSLADIERLPLKEAARYGRAISRALELEAKARPLRWRPEDGD